MHSADREVSLLPSEAQPSSDPVAIAQYRAQYEAYLMREYGDFYTQAKADGLLFN